MEKKIARICWNTKGWRFPSGPEGKSPAKFEREHGYGHEEWLFDESRVIEGYHYAFLQPLNLKTDRHVGNYYDIYLYTITSGVKFFIAEIKNAKCISKEKSQEIFTVYERNGWLRQMEQRIIEVEANHADFRKTPPEIFFNVKFRFENVERMYALETIPPGTIKAYWYRLQSFGKKPLDREIKRARMKMHKNTKTITRKYSTTHTYDQYHNWMQEKIHALLKEKYTQEYIRDEIYMEEDWVDIKAKTHDGNMHFFEIKIDSPRLSIRAALGQIMEYAYWPNEEKAEKLIIVSDRMPDEKARRYLEHIRNKFKLPVYYRYFDPRANTLSEDF